MLVSLQALLLVVAIVTVWVMLSNIRKSQIRIEDSMFWFIFSAILLCFAIFPHAIIVLSQFLGFESPANFVFLVIIFLLILNQYNLLKKTALLDIRLKTLVQHIAIKEEKER